MSARITARQCRRKPKNHRSDVTKFGELVTGDHLISASEEGRGIGDRKVGMVLYDRGIKFCSLYLCSQDC
eukprot:4317334-Heterocapsa_arctica.AAC.1